MRLIINGMDMPNDCCQCKLARYDDYENETFCPFTDVMCLSIGRQDNCPLEELPSAPDVIRCKDCAKREYCRTSNTWAVTPKDDWFCADAERRTDG